MVEKNDPVISIIIPVYNAAQYIRRCIDSILEQDFEDYEIILVNDGSSDSSLDILREFEKNNKNIRVIDQSNSGASVARNKGIEVAKGTFIMFIDIDDYISSDYLSTFFDSITTLEADIVIGGFKRVENEKTMYSFKLSDDSWSKYRSVSPWSKIYRRDFLLQNALKFKEYALGEDVLFNLSAYSKTDKIFTIPFEGYYWYFNSESLSNTVNKGFNSSIEIQLFLDEILQCISSFKEEEYMKFFIKKFCIYWLLDGGRQSSPTQFIEQYEKIDKWIKGNKMVSKISVFDSRLKSERSIVKCSIFFLDCISKLGLIKLFSKIYCKG